MTTENNRADALTETLKEEMDRLHREFSAMSPLKQRMWLMQHAAASPVEQLAAAPIPEDCDVRNILLDVVPGEDGEGQEVYARNVADVERLLSEMGEKLDAAKQPAPSPADKRAAFVERVMGMFEAWPNGKPGPTDEPESHYRFGYNTALEDVLTALDVGSPTRRAASANETGAEGATWYDRWQAECTRDHGEYDENAPIADRLRWWVPKSARHGTILLEDDLREAADELSRFPAMSAAAPADGACKHCGSTTAQACNDVGCFYLESGDGEPSAAPADERAVSFEAWCDRFPEISAVERLRDAWQEARAALPEDRIDWIANTHCPGGTAYPVNVKNAIREALREARIPDNETGAQVAQQLSAEITELKIKLVSYEREREDQTRYLAAQSEEIADLKQQLAQADARVRLTATVIQKCIDSCAAEYLEDVTGHPEDAAYCQGITDCIDALNRLKTADWSVIFAAHSGQSEPKTATVARIEQLRKALFESRDVMRVMSNWVKKSDTAGHSWAVRMVDRANAALNGEPEPRAEVMLFADNDERDEFIRVCQDFDDDGETCVDYELLMKWASNGLLDCDHFTITKKGRAAIDAARTGASS
ncbi:gp43 [Burkholderia pseudomallei]|nr:gp43 [Burkholderia pseudomallei]